MNALPEAVAALLRDAPPETAPSWVAEKFHVAPNVVTYAIRTGRLPARAIPTGNGRHVYVVRPVDAALIWGQRLVNAA